MVATNHLLIYILIIYFVVINIAGFAIMAIDKKRAIERRWRIRERVLFLFCIIGGSIGTILGMVICRHKTKHWYFVVGMPFILICQLILGSVLLFHH